MIHVKVIQNRFVTCFPMPPTLPEEETFPQRLVPGKAERAFRHRHIGAAGSTGILDYVLTKQDQAA